MILLAAKGQVLFSFFTLQLELNHKRSFSLNFHITLYCHKRSFGLFTLHFISQVCFQPLGIKFNLSLCLSARLCFLYFVETVGVYSFWVIHNVGVRNDYYYSKCTFINAVKHAMFHLLSLNMLN